MKSMFLHDLKVACRSLLKYKLQTVISVVGLAVGLTCFVVCNRMLRDYLAWDRKLPDAENIYFLSMPEYEYIVDFLFEARMDICNNFPEIEETTVFLEDDLHCRKNCIIEDEYGNEKHREETFIYSDSSFLDFFEIELLQGNWDVVKKQPDAVLLTESAALRMFGTKDVVGKIFMDINEYHSTEKECKIAALIADFPQQTFLGDVNGLVLNTTEKDILEWRFKHFSKIFLRLSPNVDMETLNNKIELYLKKNPDLKDDPSLFPRLFHNLESSDYFVDSKLNTFLIISGVGLLVLLTAIFNYVMFMSGRILNRQKEYGIRQISGASSKSIFRMFATEITLSIGFSVLIAMIFIELFARLLTEDVLGVISFDEKHNWLLILGGYLLEYTLLVWGIMMGVCWLILKRFRVLTTLQHIQGGVRYKNKLSNLLLGLQLTICILLSGGSYFLYVQQEFLMEQYRGNLSVEESKRIYNISLSGMGIQVDDFQNRINSNPHIEMICRSRLPIYSFTVFSLDMLKMEGINNKSGEKAADRLFAVHVDANFSKLISAKMEEGRFFRADETNSVVVNREFVRHFNINPLGKEISIDVDHDVGTYHIVGIMENIMLPEEPRPCIYFPFLESDSHPVYIVKLFPGAKPEVLEPLKEKMQELYQYRFRELPIWTLEKFIGYRIIDIQNMKLLLFILASICIIICLLGIYSSMMLAVEKRGREMAIRKINGARLIDIGRIFVRHYFVLLGVASLIAFPVLYLGVQTWLESYTYRVSITPFPFIAIFVVLFAIVLLTIGSQLLKIMRVNPVKKLKSE